MLDFNAQTCLKYCQKDKLVCDLPIGNDGYPAYACLNNESDKSTEVGL